MVDPRLVEVVGGLIQRHERPGHIPVIAIAGAQGCGKSTLADAAAEAFGAVRLSLDDHYLSRAERSRLGETLHPLFATRGPPGTHDVAGLMATISALRGMEPGRSVVLPTFDKRTDDRLAQADWRKWRGRPRAILVEGWCVGASAQAEGDMVAPINRLEREEDPDGIWRRIVNNRLATEYGTLFAGFDALVFLKASRFAPVLGWRCEQEEGLLGLAPGTLPATRRAELARFIQHYERITRHMLGCGVSADVTVELDADRGVRHIGGSGT